MNDLHATIPALLERNRIQRGDQPALLVRREGVFEACTWSEIEREVSRMAALLRGLGIEPGQRVAQVAENRHEWIIADLAILLAGAAHVPVHATLSGEQIVWQICHSGAALVLLSGQQQADQIAPHAESLPREVRFMAYDAWPGCENHPLAVQPLASLLAGIDDGQAAALREECLPRVQPRDLATIMYTSGTTGLPRGVMLTHGNLASNAIAAVEAFGDRPDDLRLCFLPLSHIYARTCDLYTWLYCGSKFALAHSRETILADCAEVRPTLINGVPYFYEKLCRGLREAGKLEVHGSIVAALGGRVRACFSGGAALPDHVAEAFERQAVPLLEGYGLSETSPVISLSTNAACKRGAVGRAIGGIEVKLDGDGEILTRGPHVMLGYWHDEEATREAIRDGWLHTGDLGRIDDEGFLFITGRKKEILVTAAGKNVVPTWLEGLLLASPLIAQAMVVGEGRNYLAALIVPEAEALRAWIRSNRLLVFTKRGALTHRRVLAHYREEIDRLLAGAARHEQIGQFTLLDRGFTIEGGELTPKGSLRREVIVKRFADQIEAMYRRPR